VLILFTNISQSLRLAKLVDKRFHCWVCADDIHSLFNEAIIHGFGGGRVVLKKWCPITA